MPKGVYIRIKRMTEETKRKIGDSNRGKPNPMKGIPRTKKIKRKISKSKMGHIVSISTRKKISRGNTGKIRSKETRRKYSASQKGRIHPHSEKTKREMSRLGLKRWQNPEYREKQIKAIFAKYNLKPTKPERRLRNGLNKMFPGEYKYTGDGSIAIGYKNPDFINVNGQKKIIELFGDYWHSKKVTGRTRKEEEQQRIKHFKKYGYKTLIVWEYELKDIKRLRRKLIEFYNQ